MMTVAPVASAADAAGYYSSKDNYYFLDDMPTQWLGEGARELGLEGPVDLDTFTAILHGNLPNGVTMGKEVQGEHVHRPGHDFTFSAPKSVSMLILAGGDKRLLEAHHDAVKETLAIMEQTVSARDTKEGVTRIVTSGKMVAALFTHDTSRNLDPQIHTHAVVANVTELDGKWKALATDTIHGAGFIETAYRNQITYGKIYRNVLKGKAEAMGYETLPTGGRHDLWEIKGFTEAVLDEFSSRHREIHARAGEDASLKSRDVAALDTRQRKQDISRYGEDETAPVRTRPEPSAVSVPEHVVAATEKAAATADKEPTTPSAQDKNVAIARPGPSHVHEQTEPAPERAAADTEKAPANADKALSTPSAQVKDEPIAKPETADGRARLQARWQRQMDDAGFDIQGVMNEAREREKSRPEAGKAQDIPGLAVQAVRIAISVLSDNKTRFTYGDLLLTAHNAGELQNSIPDLRRALDQAIHDNLLVPLDGDKGVFTSHIHLLDELSVQSLAADILKENRVVNFSLTGSPVPGHLEHVAREPAVIINAPASVGRLREVTKELVTMSREQGREVSVLTSSAERALSFAKSPELKDRLLHRSRMLDGTFSLTPQSTVIVEGAEKLSLKEMLVLTGEAQVQNAQLLFLDSAGRQSNTSALSVLTAAGVKRQSLNAPPDGIEVRVTSIQDKRDRYQALAERFAGMDPADGPVTAVVAGPREQAQLTGVIRNALQDAGRLGQESVSIVARTPVFTTAKERRLPQTYRAGMVLEDRSEKNETRHYVIDRVHDETRMLSLVDGDGVLSRVKLSALSGDWRLFTQNQMNVAAGERLFALAGDKHTGLKARDRLTVTAIENGSLVVQREGQKKPLRLDASGPLYVTYGYVSPPGSRDNERGTVLASLGAQDLSVNMINALAQSGHQAEIFTGEALSRAEEKLGRLRSTRSPLSLVRQASGKEDANEAVDALNKQLLSDAQKAVTRSVAQMRDVAFPWTKLLEEALTFNADLKLIENEIARQVKEGDLIRVQAGSEARFVARSTWEMEKAILGEIERGKNTQVPLMAQVDPALLSGLTQGQKEATSLILQSPDRFTAVQGYAGVGKTTQFNAVKAAIDTLPADARPVIVGLGPTHRAVKEMAGTGIDAQTLKSFVLGWQMRTAAGEDVRYDNMLFLIDESSMIGNQDTAAAYRAIAAGNGRAVPVGDVAQLQSPESGAPFQLMQERSPIDVAVMKEIVRQRDTDLKSAVYSIISNDFAAALRNIEKVSPDVVPRRTGKVHPSGSIVQSADPVSSIVADFMSRTDEAREQTMIMVQLHDDRKAINEGIHNAMVMTKELGETFRIVPVLDRINGGRHDFNRIDDWETGQVVMANQRYLQVTGVDPENGSITLQDEAGRTHFWSSQELNATEIEVFETREIELRTGDSVRLSKTQKQAGHAAHEQYRVDELRDNGEIVLRNGSGVKVIDPAKTLADRHVDYSWAVTGYGAQGASARYSLALEGVVGARELMSGARAFYINVSRAKDHVQIVTDDRAGWTKTLGGRKNEPATAHDALMPEPERAQARRIWAMGQAASKTAIGRAFLRSTGLSGSPVTARIIPPTRKFPEPHLALPVYDGNGKAAGLTMAPLRHHKGSLTPGQTRQLVTEGAQAAMLQKSRSGEVLLVSDLTQGFAAAREKPEAGVLIVHDRQLPSAQLLKVAGGQPDQLRRPDATLLSQVKAELQEMLAVLPRTEKEQDERDTLRSAIKSVSNGGLMERTPLPETPPARDGMDKITLAVQLAESVAEVMEQKVPRLPGESQPDYSALVRQAARTLADTPEASADAAVRAGLGALSASGIPDSVRQAATAGNGGVVPAAVVREVQEELSRSRSAVKAAQPDISSAALADVARELDRQAQVSLPPEMRGREQERTLSAPEITRHIQKER
ncbi:conjugative relaxase-like TrwC/TraI family protein [Pantoea sp. AN62]|uniref:MobF family relaxase n=1 Tax=Pantoea TaxID=53335 RepID=UPI000B7FA8EF|nr:MULTISPECIES: MobF family relaxase [Pantoea]MDU4747888.1 MobF family relaxase [Pantoea sp.]HCR0227202.1 conjugative relaxase [Enterobacter kobei]OXM21242.1 conjugal transfer protein TraI [Pantoea sp. AV62]HCR0505821.1 conjugative relaxase [Enterobacter kobei]HCR0864730.1 conjugative relaxase [Enterobacter kobei]